MYPYQLKRSKRKTLRKRFFQPLENRINIKNLEINKKNYERCNACFHYNVSRRCKLPYWRNMKVLVSGLINIESNVFVNNFPVEYSPIEYAFNQVNFDFSGVAYNIIKALSALGDKTIPVSIIGKDNIANLILAELKRSKIPCDFIFQDLKTTCSSVILFDSQGKRKIYCDLKNIQDFVIPLEKIEESLKSIDGLIL